jgi:predicted Rossmann fold nucleotide-binding protein DprA/Smf involved in DNA uptake
VSTVALSPDGEAIVLLCSTLGLPRQATPRPLAPKEWDSLAASIHESELRTPGALFRLEAGDIAGSLGVSNETARRLEQLLARSGQLAMELDRLRTRGIWIVTRADESYPPLLRTRLKATAPPVLFGAGNPAALANRSVAVVGSRDADESSTAFATAVGRSCARNGFAVVSGAARGVDTAAMLAAADAGGIAIGVVAEALERALRRQDLRANIADGELTLIAVQHPGAGFSVGGAMGRNRLIYCLAEAAVVVASRQSGGTRAGALENLKAGWVPLFVRDDPNAPPGNRELLDAGGLAITRDDLTGDSLGERLRDTPAVHYQPTLEEAAAD